MQLDTQIEALKLRFGALRRVLQESDEILELLTHPVGHHGQPRRR